jgi:hypothetical protein
MQNGSPVTLRSLRRHLRGGATGVELLGRMNSRATTDRAYGFSCPKWYSTLQALPG